MVTRKVVLTETQVHLVQVLVAPARHQNVSEAIRAGLKLLEQEEARPYAVKTVQVFVRIPINATCGNSLGISVFRQSRRQSVCPSCCRSRRRRVRW